jgi:fermentation-respiration switch protein FrsA (DUF1100 family)
VRRLVTVVAIGALVLLGLVGMLWAFQRTLIYFPSQDVGDLRATVSDAEDVTFTTADGLELGALLVPAFGDANGATVLVFNGNAGNRGDRVPLATALAARGYRVLLFDYRGYGGNPGTPTEEGLTADGLAAISHLESRPDVDTNRIVYFGESLGAGVAIAVAEHRPPAALVLRSPFSSLSEVGSFHYPFLPISILLWDRYQNVQRIGGIERPLLVVAGSADATVPFAQSQEVYGAASEPKQFLVIDGADHNDFELTASRELVDEIVAFLNGHGLSASG